MKFFTGAVIAFFAMTALCFAENNDFILLPTSGNAPLSVTIDAPLSFMKLIENCVYTQEPVTPGIFIDWGDGVEEPVYTDPLKQGQSCAHVKAHVYQIAGVYTVTARQYHLDPTNGAETNWEGMATVHVGKNDAQANINILSPAVGATLGYQKPVMIKGRLATHNTVDIHVVLSAANGVIIAEKTLKALSNAQDFATELSLSGADYEMAVRKQWDPISLTVTVFTDGEKLAADALDNLHLSANEALGAH